MLLRSGSAHNFDLEAGLIFKICGVVVGASSVGVAIRIHWIPAVVRCGKQDAINVVLGPSMKREVVDSRQSSVVCAPGEGGWSRGHEVDVPTSPRGSTVPLLVNGPTEFHEKPAPRYASAVEVCDPNLNVMHTNCHIAIVPRASRIFFPRGNGGLTRWLQHSNLLMSPSWRAYFPLWSARD